MEVFKINNLANLPLLDPNSCVIGALDGLHRGHQDLIKRAKEYGLKTLVIIFDNLKKESNYISTTEQKIKFIEEMEVDYLIIFRFLAVEKVFFNEFIKILKSLKVKNIVCGNDFRFGYKREGDIIDLTKHFKVNIVDYLVQESCRVSTSNIKELLYSGLIEKANLMIGRPYTIQGEVIKGNQIGRKLGFPTANIDYKDYVLPKNGVYFVKVKYNDIVYKGMANIGFNPTLNEQTTKRLEVHIIDFDKDIYGEVLDIEFYQYLREEKRFNSKDELVNSLNDTISICKSL